MVASGTRTARAISVVAQDGQAEALRQQLPDEAAGRAAAAASSDFTGRYTRRYRRSASRLI
jgi:hypothetical protein